MNRSVPVFVLLGSSILWGVTWLPLKYFGTYGIQGPLVTLCAHGSLGLIALPLLWRRRGSLRAHRWPMLWLAFVAGLANVAFASAMLVGDVTRVMALFYLLPAWGVLGGRFLLGERIDGSRWLSLVGALLGAFLILGGPDVLASPPGWVDFVAVLSGLAYAMNNVLFRKAHQVPVSTKVGVTFVGCLAWAAGLTALGADSIPRTVPTGVWLMLVGFGLVWILLATLGTLWAVDQMEAGRSSVLIIMELVAAVVSAALLLGDVPLPIEWAGGALILFAAVLEARRVAAPGLAEPSEPRVCGAG